MILLPSIVGTIDLLAEQKVKHVQFITHHEVVPAPLKEPVTRHAHAHIEITARGTAFARFAHAFHLYELAILNAG